MLQETVILIINNLLVNAEIESAEKVNMRKLVQKIDASKKFQLSHNGGDVIKCSNFKEDDAMQNGYCQHLN